MPFLQQWPLGFAPLRRQSWIIRLQYYISHQLTEFWSRRRFRLNAIATLYLWSSKTFNTHRKLEDIAHGCHTQHVSGTPDLPNAIEHRGIPTWYITDVHMEIFIENLRANKHDKKYYPTQARHTPTTLPHELPASRPTQGGPPNLVPKQRAQA